MKHYGDITKINGAEAPVVDIITGGSPCQDLSVAGKRAGLAGERSGLFMEQMRIVKEMRERERETGRTGCMVRPRYMVWENVPGVFSSNGGEDFRTVLEEFARIAEPDAVIPRPPKGKWPHAGAVGDGVANTGGAMNPWDSQSARVYPDNGVWHSLNANENGGQSRDSVFCLQGNGIDRADTAGCNGRGRSD